MHAHAERPPDAPPIRSSHEVADVVRLCGEAFARTHRLGPEQLHLLGDLGRCRTPALGGHLDACAACGFERPSYLDGADRGALFDGLHRTRWIVYAKRPFGGAEHVIRYLGRYTHRVGISNARIRSVAPSGVRFRTKAGRELTLAPEEFLRRFLLHVLPRGFTKIRHFGLLAAGNVGSRLERARSLLTKSSASASPSATPRSTADLLLAWLGVDPRLCPRCHASAMTHRPLPAPRPEPRDTS